MIIKYYNNGWNYIDEVENVKWINKTVEKVADFRPSEAVGGRIYVTDKEIELTILKQRIEQDLHYQLDIGSIMGGELFCDIDYKNMQRILGQEAQEYVRVVMYDNKEGIRKGIAFTHAGYLLNNNGQTIERLG